VLQIQDAEHEETAPGSPRLVINKLACSLVGTTQAVIIRPGTLSHEAYGTGQAAEQFRCSYGLNPEYQDLFADGRLEVAGTGPAGEVRIVELSGHVFFLATLFVPQLSSSAEMPHPLISAFLKAVASRRGEAKDR
jgi:CTP synthase (UTP-ammonia lyase)